MANFSQKYQYLPLKESLNKVVDRPIENFEEQNFDFDLVAADVSFSSRITAFSPASDPINAVSSQPNHGSAAIARDSNSLLDRSFGWLDNKINSHGFNSDPAIKCSCPGCSGSPSGLSDSFKFFDRDLLSASFQPQNATTGLSGDYQIDGVLSGYKWGFSAGSNQLTYSFYESSIYNGSYYGSETGVTEVSDAVKNNVRTILGWIENIVNIDFVEVTETASNYGKMRFMLADNPSYAYAYYPYSDTLQSQAGDVFLKTSYDNASTTNGFQNPAGKHGYMSLIHEIGHALGLKHSFEGSSILPGAEDNTTNTVMTYNFTGNSAGTFMPYDIKALQYLYGTKVYNTGNDSYQFGTRVDQYSVNGQLFLNTPYSTKLSIWDSSGTDTLDFSSLAANSSGYRFDLNPGGILSTKTAYNGTSYTSNGVTYKTTTFGSEIAYNVTIENLVNSSSNDEIFANSAANRFGGYTSGRVTGNDILWNTNSQDILDLSSYSASAVSQTQNGSDLFLGLGSNGSITVKNYFAGEKINLLLDNEALISVNDISFKEGSGAVFTVSLVGSSSQSVSVNYATADGSAIAGLDYTATSGTLTFNPGETSKTVAVQSLNDANIESNETFFLNLGNVQNGKLTDSQGMATIIDNPLPTLSVNDISLKEGSNKKSGATTNFQFTLNLSGASSQAVTVQYALANGTAIAGSDYISSTGNLTFNAGETSKTLTVKVYADKIVESNENFFVNLQSATNAKIGDAQGMATILNDDSSSSTGTKGKRNGKVSAFIDRLTGSQTADTFVLGDSQQAFYHHAGSEDYGVIANFNLSQNDTIQLYGNASDYYLNVSSGSLPTGTAIFREMGGQDELVGIVEDVYSLSLDSNAFTFMA